MLNAIREMIVNGIVMQRVYSRASIFGRSSDHGSFIPILNLPRAKSDFQSRIQGKRRLIDHRKRSFTLFFISPSLSLSRERETFATTTRNQPFMKEEEVSNVSIHRVREEEERRKGRKKGSTGAINLRNAASHWIYLDPISHPS